MNTTMNKIIYTEENALAMLGGKVHKLDKVQEWDKVVHVVKYKKQGERGISTFLSKRKLKEYFVKIRKDNSKNYKVTGSTKVGSKTTGYFVEPKDGVYEPSKYTTSNASFKVDKTPKSLKCNCDDYENQIQILGNGCCRHIYAVLEHLGYVGNQSLKQYEKDHSDSESHKSQKPHKAHRKQYMGNEVAMDTKHTLEQIQQGIDAKDAVLSAFNLKNEKQVQNIRELQRAIYYLNLKFDDYDWILCWLKLKNIFVDYDYSETSWLTWDDLDYMAEILEPKESLGI